MGEAAPLTRAARAAAVVCAAVVSASLLAQSPATLAEARAALKAGHAGRALALLADASTPDALRLKTLAALQASQLDAALDAYAARMAADPAHDPALQKAIAEAYLSHDGPSAPREAAIARCRREVTASADPEAPRRPARTAACVSEMKAIADDATAATAVRGAAALVMVQAGDTKAAARITGLAVTPSAGERRSLLPVLERAPAAVAVPILMAMLDDDDFGIQHAAAAAMGAFPTPEAKLALQGYLSITFRRIARQPTIVSLATMGDAEAVRELRGLLPQLTGMDLVNGAAALAAIHDPRGVEVLERAAESANEQVRAAAGARLATTRPAVARAVFERGMGHAAGAVRALTLDAFAATPLVDEARLLGVLRDGDAVVRVRAAEALWTLAGGVRSSKM